MKSVLMRFGAAMALAFPLAAGIGQGAVAQQRMIGQTSGASQEFRCPPGQWLTGLIGRQGALLDSLGISCAAIDLTQYKAIPPAANQGPFGGAGGAPKSVWCPNGTLPMGIIGVQKPDVRAPKIIHVQLNCYPYRAIQGRPMSFRDCASATTVGAGVPCSASQRLGGPADPSFSRQIAFCPGRSVVVGARIWADRTVNGVQALCG